VPYGALLLSGIAGSGQLSSAQLDEAKDSGSLEQSVLRISCHCVLWCVDIKIRMAAT
jgi:hypothetical protein